MGRTHSEGVSPCLLRESQTVDPSEKKDEKLNVQQGKVPWFKSTEASSLARWELESPLLVHLAKFFF